MQPKVQKEVLGRTVSSTPEELSDFKVGRVTINGTVYPIIKHLGGSKVKGIALVVNDQDLVELDKYEKEAYSRRKVILESGKEAWAYIEL